MKIYNQKLKRMISLGLMICVIFVGVSGCRKTVNSPEKDNENQLVEVSLGNLPEVEKVFGLIKDDSGEYQVYGVDKNNHQLGVYISKDEGRLWETADIKNNIKLGADDYIIAGDAGANGSLSLYYTDSRKDKDEKNILFSNGKNDFVTIDIQGNNPVLGLRLSQDGEGLYVNRGELLECYDSNGKIVNTYEYRNIIDYIEQDSMLWVLGSEGLVCYDCETGEEKKQDKLFVKEIKRDLSEAYEVVSGVMSDTGRVLKQDLDGSLYFMLSSGIYKYNDENGFIKSIIENSSTSFLKKDCSMIDYIIDDEKHIRVLARETAGYHILAYNDKKHAPEPVTDAQVTKERDNSDPDKLPESADGKDENLFADYQSTYVAKTNEELTGTVTVYSLLPTDAVSDYVDVYQTTHPNVDVQLEVGVEEDSNVTVEQAVNALNTELLSGNGPDVLILDGLDRKQYEENGLLMDLNELYKEVQKEHDLFTNITDAYYEGKDKIYAIPTHFEPTLFIGKDDVVNSIHSLEDLADFVEKDKTTIGNALNMYTVKQLFHAVYPCYSSLVVNEDRTYDEEKLKEMVTQMKRIWERLSEQTKKNNARKEYEEIAKEREGDGINPDEWEFLNLRDFYTPDMSNRSVGISVIYRRFEIYLPVSICKVDEKYMYKAMPFGANGSYVPTDIASIVSHTRNEEVAKDFVKEMFAPNEQTMLGTSAYGIPVNHEALRNTLSLWGSKIESTYNGQNVTQKNWISSQKEYDTMLEYIESFETPADMNETVKGIVLENLEEFLNEDLSLNDYTKKVNGKLNTYLNE